MKLFLRTCILMLMIFSGHFSFSQTPQTDGQWGNVIPFDIVPVAMANLPDGRVITWSAKSKFSFGGADGFTYTQIFDPTIGIEGDVLPETLTNTNHDMFCPGINNLADGRIMATGGSSSGKATIYDPVLGAWEATDNMNRARGYQGAVTLSDGSVFTIGGSWSGGRGNKDAEIWTDDTGWTVLTGLPKEILWNANDAVGEITAEGSYRLDNHAWLWAAPNGKIFHAGPGETMHWIDVTGNGSSTVVGQRGSDVYSMNGTTVMYDIGKILKFGGSTSYSQGTPSNKNAYIIDINDENNVTVTLTANTPEEGRIFPTSVVLPNGEVLLIGGMETSVPFSDNGAHLSLEIFNPDDNSIRTVVDMDEARTYHSAGLLLNDGRVLMGGGGLCGGCNTNHANAEIYSPPYLFDINGDLAVRPTLSAPDTAYYDGVLPVLTSTDVTEFSFVRLSSATHSVNNEQRRVPVTFTGSNGDFQLNMPNANIMPPGYYMLFAMNADGVPSLSKTVLVKDDDSIIMKDNLIVAYDFFEGIGSLINDLSGNSNSGTIKQRDDNGNEITLTDNFWNEDGFLGTSLEMDGLDYLSNSIVEIPTSTSLETLTNQISVMAWVNRNTGSVIPANGNIPNATIFAHEFPSLYFGYVQDQYQFRILTDSNSLANCVVGEYVPGEWEHVAGTYDGVNLRLYVNGQEICSTPITGNMKINTEVAGDDTFTLSGFYDTQTIGQLPGYANGSGITDELDGSMDKFKLYNIALTSQDIQNIYNEEVGDVQLELENNLALNQPTSQSSLFTNGESSKAVDGNTDGNFGANPNSVTHTTSGDTDAWWRVDLGDDYDYDLTAIRIYNRTDCCVERLEDASVYIGNIDSTDPSDYTLVGTLTQNSVQILTQNLDVARYVMIRQNGIISLAEVQVFGELTNCPAEGTSCDDGNPNTSNDVESGECSCAGTPIICENVEIISNVNGETDSNETEINVSVGDNVSLSLNLEDITSFIITDPNGIVLGSNTINNIALSQSGLYTITSILDRDSNAQHSPPLPQPTVIFTNSEETAAQNNVASNAVDGNTNTIWHTQYSDINPDTPHPHEIQIDLGIESNITGLEYLPRTSGLNGTIADYEIYISNSTSVWGSAVNSGTWASDNQLKTANFTNAIGRYVRLVALSEVNGNAWASAAEISLIRTVPTACVKTIQISVDTETNYTFNSIDGWLPSDPNNQSNFNDDIIIQDGEAVFSMNTTCRNITVNPGAALTINAGVTLTTEETTLTSTSQLYSSLIADGNIEGSLKYQRYVNANNGGNDLISPPLQGETWQSFIQSGSNASDLLNDGNNNPVTYLFGPFDKDQDDFINYTDAATSVLISGKGYRAGTIAGSNLTFTGSVPSGQINVNIIDAGSNFPDWNLIGNPYPSYLDMNLFLNYVLDSNTNPVTTNISILQDISGIYGYGGNGSANRWSIITLANASQNLMTPGQGFFVAANDTYVNDYDIVFDDSMRAIGANDDFVEGRIAQQLTFLNLNISNHNEEFTTEFYFNENASLGLNPGYDGKFLGNYVPSFAIYSHLVEDNDGLPIALQALNPNDLADTVIPLGVNANQGEEIVFSIEESTIPLNVEVYLEDNFTNSITLLNNTNYSLVPSTNLNGTGRFYLRFASSVLSTNENSFDYLEIYATSDPKVLVISGELNSQTNLHLYDVQGRLVLTRKIDHLKVLNTIDVSMLGNGVYIAKVFNDSQSKTKKLIIK
ncbi:discoidin domain-containing protein [Winogradskyella sp. PE311]|uniref:discoidin domain-containing protein n=1 Tax=Winogradskyella sp. PE311 TaxID=3366943 RepID=UPI003980A1C7